MTSGSSGRIPNLGSKLFDFESDDILCSYEDYGNQEGNNGIHSDPSSAANSFKDCFWHTALIRIFPFAAQGKRWPDSIPRRISKQRFIALYMSKFIFPLDNELSEVVGHTYLFLKSSWRFQFSSFIWDTSWNYYRCDKFLFDKHF